MNGADAGCAQIVPVREKTGGGWLAALAFPLASTTRYFLVCELYSCSSETGSCKGVSGYFPAYYGWGRCSRHEHTKPSS